MEHIIRFFACISLVIGAVECFAGFKIMKTLLAIWGFFIGAMAGVAVGVATDSTGLGVAMVILFGVILAVLSYRLYLAGIFLLTASLAGVAVYIPTDSILPAVLVAVLVGGLSIYFVKPVVILTTAISGAGIIVASAYAMMDLGVNDNMVIMTILWVPIALIGIVIQLGTTKKMTGTTVRRYDDLYDPSRSFSERKYPGMQRAYRNFCIKCGCELLGDSDECPRCSFRYDD